MLDPRDFHARFVERWLEERDPTGTSPHVVELFEQAFAAIWARVQPRIGEVTLMAVADRVLFEGRERHRCVAVASVEPTGIRLAGLRACACGHVVRRVELSFLLVEFLRILGTLTAEVLTPALHEELSRCGAAGTKDPKIRSERRRSSDDGGE